MDHKKYVFVYPNPYIWRSVLPHLTYIWHLWVTIYYNLLQAWLFQCFPASFPELDFLGSTILQGMGFFSNHVWSTRLWNHVKGHMNMGNQAHLVRSVHLALAPISGIPFFFFLVYVLSVLSVSWYCCKLVMATNGRLSITWQQLKRGEKHRVPCNGWPKWSVCSIQYSQLKAIYNVLYLFWVEAYVCCKHFSLFTCLSVTINFSFHIVEISLPQSFSSENASWLVVGTLILLLWW